MKGGGFPCTMAALRLKSVLLLAAGASLASASLQLPSSGGRAPRPTSDTVGRPARAAANRGPVVTDEWHPRAKAVGERVIRVYTSAEAYAAWVASEAASAANSGVAALFEFV